MNWPWRLLVFVAVVAFCPTPVAPSLAAGPGQYGPPEWLPLRHSSDGNPFVIGCVRTNCTVSGAPYHNYWAMDIIDHANRAGAPVFAAGRGLVVKVVSSFSACGPTGTPANYVDIDHGGGVVSEYVHMATISVSPGQWVDENTQIGTVGAVGYTFPCPYYHLHYAVFVSGTAVEPGPLKACHGASVVTYPRELGYAGWDSVPPYKQDVWSDGTTCLTTPPPPPTDVAAIPGDGEATVTFTPNGAAKYTVTASPGGATATGTDSSITVTGLTNGTPYTFVVTATNAAGDGQPSTASEAVVPVGPPGTPTRVFAEAGDRRATIRFAAPSANGSPITSYTATASPGGSEATGRASPLVVPGLTNGKRYTFVVSATNDAGTGPDSTASVAITPVGRAPLGATTKGTVLVNGRPFRTGEVPIGSMVDVSKGTLRLKTNAGALTISRAGPSSSARLLLTSASVNGTKTPLLELRLLGGRFNVCHAPAARTASVRGLRVDAQGRLRVDGRLSSATGRAAAWVVTDRCDGTLTTGLRGAVVMRELPNGKPVVVRAGASRLATGAG